MKYLWASYTNIANNNIIFFIAKHCFWISLYLNISIFYLYNLAPYMHMEFTTFNMIKCSSIMGVTVTDVRRSPNDSRADCVREIQVVENVVGVSVFITHPIIILSWHCGQRTSCCLHIVMSECGVLACNNDVSSIRSKQNMSAWLPHFMIFKATNGIIDDYKPVPSAMCHT